MSKSIGYPFGQNSSSGKLVTTHYLPFFRTLKTQFGYCKRATCLYGSLLDNNLKSPRVIDGRDSLNRWRVIFISTVLEKEHRLMVRHFGSPNNSEVTCRHVSSDFESSSYWVARNAKPPLDPTHHSCGAMYIWWAGGSLSFVSMPHWTNNSSSISLPFAAIFGGK